MLGAGLVASIASGTIKSTVRNAVSDILSHLRDHSTTALRRVVREKMAPRFAGDMKITVLDTQSALDAKTQPHLFNEDALHPNAKGSKALGRAIAEEVVEIVNAPARP